MRLWSATLSARQKLLAVPSASGISKEYISKEPDGSFKPMTRNHAVDHPSWVIEVGDSEHLAQLRLDARRWLETTPNGEVKLVLVISIDNKHARTLQFERWCHYRPPARNAGKNQELTYDHTTQQVTGAPLLLPIDLLDTVPANIPLAGVFTINQQRT